MGVTSSGVNALSTPPSHAVFERKPVVLPATLPQAYGPNVHDWWVGHAHPMHAR